MPISFAINLLLIQLALNTPENEELRELALSIKEGNRGAFKLFFDAHHRPLVMFLMKRGLSEQSADDIIQQAFLLIWEQRKNIDPEKSLKSYLFRIAYTRMLNHFRDQRKFSDSDIPEETTDTEEPVDGKAHRELAKAIEKSIAALPEKRQEVFRLCYLQEFTYKETAEIMNVSVKTVENHMSLALKELRAALSGFM